MTKPLYALALAFVVLGTIFTLFPESLEHSPVGFEQRGLIHHGFHYLILIGGLALLIGIALRDRVLESLGLVACGLPILLNLAALLTAGDLSAVSGIDIALRLVALGLVTARLSEIRGEDR